MDCYRILLFFLLASSCGCAKSSCGTTCSCSCTRSCSIAEQGCTCTESADCGCQVPDVPDMVIEYGQTPPYSFPPYPVLRE
ncbi:MAG: hypothetical protein LUC95_02860 [Lachnospiraceae bacterium]|nr:hypothetical protein [Lachnospiraceae bacterium]